MKILAVDDDHVARDLLQEALTFSGFKDVRYCATAADALAVVLDEEKPFDCFLFDIQMPGMNGIDLTQEVRALKPYKRTPIIMVTGMAEKSFVDRAFAAGATDYITKPYDFTEVSVRMNLAKELASERKLLAESTGVIESLIQELDRTTSHSVDKAVELTGVERVLSYPAFENYLFQLTRGVLFLSSIFAVKLVDVEKLHAALPPLEFKELLSRAAADIVQRLDNHDIFLSYRGNGIFVGVMRRSGVRALKQFGGGVSVAMADPEGDVPAGLPDRAMLLFGDPVISKIYTMPGSLRLLCSAIENVEGKQIAPAPQKAPGFLSSSYENRAAMAEQKRLDEMELRAEYSKLLRDGPDASVLMTSRRQN